MTLHKQLSMSLSNVHTGRVHDVNVLQRADTVDVLARNMTLTSSPGVKLGLLTLPDTWRTPHEPYGDMLCFYSEVPSL